MLAVGCIGFIINFGLMNDCDRDTQKTHNWHRQLEFGRLREDEKKIPNLF